MYMYNMPKWKPEWQKVDGNLNINDLLKFKDILPCYFGEPYADGEYLIYEFEDTALYQCKKDGTIIAVYYF